MKSKSLFIVIFILFAIGLVWTSGDVLAGCSVKAYSACQGARELCDRDPSASTSQCEFEFNVCVKDCGGLPGTDSSSADACGNQVCVFGCDSVTGQCKSKSDSSSNSTGNVANGGDCKNPSDCKSGYCDVNNKCADNPFAGGGSDNASDGSTTAPPPTGLSFFGLFEAKSIPEFIVMLYKYAISIVGLIVFIQFIRAGFIYLTAAGNTGKTGEATHLMTNAVIGTVLLFSAYLILNIINPDLLTLSTDFTPASSSNTSGPSDSGGGGDKSGDFGITGNCEGVSCGETKANICGDTQVGCGGPEKWDAQIKQGVQLGGSICGSINPEAFVRAIMSQESGGDPGAGSKAGAYGLMQILPSTGNVSNIKGPCGVTETVDEAWLKNPDNAAKSVCLAIQILKSDVDACGCNVRQLSAGYNGGGAGLGACGISQDCNGAGQCTVCQGSSVVRRWECPWEDAQHKTCNKALAGNFSATREYVPKVSYCYKKFGGGGGM